jgi:hypothetical protein
MAPTPYQPEMAGFGYSEQKLESDHYRVSFTGNSDTPREAVENGLLFRAAQITVDSGHDWFIVAGHDIDKNTGYIGLADPGYGYGAYGYPGWYAGGGVIEETPYNQYTATATIAVGTGAKPQNPNAYDAHDVLQTLQPVIQPTQPN